MHQAVNNAFLWRNLLPVLFVISSNRVWVGEVIALVGESGVVIALLLTQVAHREIVTLIVRRNKVHRLYNRCAVYSRSVRCENDYLITCLGSSPSFLTSRKRNCEASCVKKNDEEGRREEKGKGETLMSRSVETCHETRSRYCFHVHTELNTLLQGIRRWRLVAREILCL